MFGFKKRKFGDDDKEEGYAVQWFVAQRLGYLFVVVAVFLLVTGAQSRSHFSQNTSLLTAQTTALGRDQTALFEEERVRTYSRHEAHAKLLKTLALLQAHLAQERRVGVYVRVAAKQLERAGKAHLDEVERLLEGAVADHHDHLEAEAGKGAAQGGVALSVADHERASKYSDAASRARKIHSAATTALLEGSRKVLVATGDDVARAAEAAEGELKLLTRAVLKEVVADIRDEQEEERVGRFMLQHVDGYRAWLEGAARQDAARFESRAEADLGAMLRGVVHAMAAAAKGKRADGSGADYGVGAPLVLSAAEKQRARALHTTAERAFHTQHASPSKSEARIFAKAERQMLEMLQAQGVPYKDSSIIDDNHEDHDGHEEDLHHHGMTTLERFEEMLRQAQLVEAHAALGGEAARWEKGEISDAVLMLHLERRVQRGELGADALVFATEDLEDKLNAQATHADAVVFKDEDMDHRRHQAELHNVAALDNSEFAGSDAYEKLLAEEARLADASTHGADMGGAGEALGDHGADEVGHPAGEHDVYDTADADQGSADQGPALPPGVVGYDEHGNEVHDENALYDEDKVAAAARAHAVQGHDNYGLRHDSNGLPIMGENELLHDAAAGGEQHQMG